MLHVGARKPGRRPEAVGSIGFQVRCPNGHVPYQRFSHAEVTELIAGGSQALHCIHCAAWWTWRPTKEEANTLRRGLARKTQLETDR
jgi:hypothetical protein